MRLLLRPFVLSCLATMACSSLACSYDLCDKVTCDSGGAGAGGAQHQGGGSGGEPATGGNGGNGGSANVGGAGQGGDGGSGGAPPTPFHVNVVFVDSQGAGYQGQTWLHSDADGEVVEEGTLGPGGAADFDVFAGDLVTVFEPGNGSGALPPRAYSALMVDGVSLVKFIRDVSSSIPNDNVNGGPFTLRAYCSDCAGAETMEFVVSCGTPFVGAFSSSSGYVSASYFGTEGCPGSSTIDAYVYVTNAAGTINQRSAKLDIPLPVSGTIQMPQTDVPTMPLEFVWGVSGANAAMSISREMYNPRNGRDSFRRSTHSASTTEVFKMPGEWLSDPIMTTRVGDSFVHRKEQATLDGSPYTVDAAHIAFPDKVPTLDLSNPARPSFDYTLGTGTAGDALQISLAMRIGDAIPSRWTIALPAQPGKVRLPTLPADLEAYGGELLLNTITNTRSVDISDVDIEGVASYGEYLQIGVVDDKGDRSDVTEIWRADTGTACADPSAC